MMNGPTSDSEKQSSSVDVDEKTGASATPEGIPAWVIARLGVVGKEQVLDELNGRAQTLTPFEMRTLLDPEAISVAFEEKRGRFGRLIEAIRNGFILAPVIVTWFSLALASAAYLQSISLIKNPNAQTPPFLQLWEQGFPAVKQIALGPFHISLLNKGVHYFTFSGVALTDATLLAILFILTLWAQGIEYVVHHKTMELFTYLERELHRLSLQSPVMSLGRNGEQLDPLVRGVYETLSSMNTLMREVRSTIETTIGTYERAVLSQREAVSNLINDTKQIHKAIGGVKDLIQTSKETFEPMLRLIEQMERHASSLDRNQMYSTEAWKTLTDSLLTAVATIAALSGDPDLVKRAQTTARHYAKVHVQPFTNTPPISWGDKIIKRIRSWF